jgi:hypothetical protein
MPFGSLWLPVIVSAVAVFVVSSLIHMVLKYHKADHKALPREEQVRQALGGADPAPGLYMTPWCADHSQLNEPAVREKFAKGPVAIITVLPKGVPVLPKHLLQWFAFSVLISFLTAYVARHTLQPGADPMLVMRVTSTVAFLGYGFSHLSDSIWKGQPWSNTVRALIDGGVYALVTALAFRFLWPAA